MFIILWRYAVRPDRIDAFIEHYRSDGSWARLFRSSTGYLGTDLIRATDNSVSFVTIDRWDSAESFERFKRERREDYDRLDRVCESLTVTEELIGRYNNLT